MVDDVGKPTSEGTQSLPVLEALAQLTPPGYGPVERVELSGTLSNHLIPTVLTPKNSLSVRRALALVAPNKVAVKVRGMVREFDKDDLRNVTDGLQRHCFVEGEAADTALAVIENDFTVEVVGYEVPGTSDIDVLTVTIVSGADKSLLPST